MSRFERTLFLFIITWLFVDAGADNEMRGVRLSSCNKKSCARLVTAESFRTPFQPNFLVFGEATLVLSDGSPVHAEHQRFQARDGYFDIEDQVIVLRKLINSHHQEVIYNLKDGNLISL